MNDSLNFSLLSSNFTSYPSLGRVVVDTPCVALPSLGLYKFFFVFVLFVLILVFFYIALLKNGELKKFGRHSKLFRQIMFNLVKFVFPIYAILLFYIFYFK